MQRARGRSLRRRFTAQGVWRTLPTGRQLEGTPQDTIWNDPAVPILLLPGGVSAEVGKQCQKQCQVPFLGRQGCGGYFPIQTAPPPSTPKAPYRTACFA